MPQNSVSKYMKKLTENNINIELREKIKLQDKYPQVLNLWSDKNKKSPNEYAVTSNKKVWWKCVNGKHNDYFRSINTSTLLDFRCPECSQERTESALQEKVRLYLESLHYTILHERNCSLIPRNPKIKNKHGQMPFDNEIKELHLLIETMGLQHYQELSKSNPWLDGKDPKEALHKRQLYDRYKKFIAYKNRYNYLAIPYWTNDEKETWKQLINNKINEILKNSDNYYITTDESLIDYLKSLKFKYKQQDNKYIFNNSLKLYKCIQFYIKINKENEDCEVISIC